MNTLEEKRLGTDNLVAVQRLRDRTHLPDAQAPYHGISHPTVVWSKAVELVERCTRYGIPVNVGALRSAVDLHDSLAHLDPKLLNFESSEALAANLTFRFLISEGFSEEAAVEVASIVMATHPDVRPATTEQIIMRAADLWSIAGTYEEFSAAGNALHREQCVSQGCEVPRETWVRGAQTYLRRFLWPMLTLTPEAADHDGRSFFHARAMQNLARQWGETFGDESHVVAEVFSDGEIKPTTKGSNLFYMAFHPEESCRRDALQIFQGDHPLKGSAAFVIPGAPQSLSLPDGLCDTVISHTPSLEAVCEAVRAAKDGGVIVVHFREGVTPEVARLASSLHSSVIDCEDSERGKLLVMVKTPFL